ncbi:MAG: hypothetical protein JNJ60_13060 [Rhodocyclaceae bacterium]|nr:hypothetical protein [Rhodocyclaceae bacterium]
MTEPAPAPDAGRAGQPESEPGFALAVAAESLYLVNLLLVPGLAFIVLFVLWLRHRAAAPLLARNHLRQTVAASFWAAGLLVAANAAIIALGGYRSPDTWVVVILYFTTCHSTLVCFGALGLARALAGRTYIYPLIGPDEPEIRG